MDTLVVNLFAGPGTGKSTNAALTFGKLKSQGVVAEFATEYAKDLVWEERHHALGFQPYIIAKQMWKIQRLIGKVSVVITDSPILLGLIYGAEGYGDGWRQHLLEVFNSWNNLNIRLIRDDDVHPYVPHGRTQKTVKEAQEIDHKILQMLHDNHIPYHSIEVVGGENTANAIVDLVKQRMDEDE